MLVYTDIVLIAGVPYYLKRIRASTEKYISVWQYNLRFGSLEPVKEIGHCISVDAEDVTTGEIFHFKSMIQASRILKIGIASIRQALIFNSWYARHLVNNRFKFLRKNKI